MILVSPFDYICHALNSRFIKSPRNVEYGSMSYFSSVKLDCFLEEQYAVFDFVGAEGGGS
ncbi:hypothetical protein Peur_022270 [Populus x canadensis]